jgi:hypothetical protein
MVAVLRIEPVKRTRVYQDLARLPSAVLSHSPRPGHGWVAILLMVGPLAWLVTKSPVD